MNSCNRVFSIARSSWNRGHFRWRTIAIQGVRNYHISRDQKWRPILCQNSMVNSARTLWTSNTIEQATPKSELLPDDVGSIPDPPSAISNDAVEPLQRLSEANLHELGLGSYFTPAGWVQNLLNDLHLYTGLPWCEVIVLGTIFIRTCTFPLLVRSQRVSAIMAANIPEMERLARQLEDAKKAGDRSQVQLSALEMKQFLQEQHLPAMIKLMAPLLVNGVMFTTYFFAIRGMATKPLASMQTEGALWFTDLTAADPMLILPTLVAIGTLAVFELGVETGVGTRQMPPGVRWMMRILPFTLLLFAGHMPAAIWCYWFTSNFISVLLAFLFRTAVVRRVLKIPPLAKRDSMKSWKESWQLPQFVRDYLSAPRLLMRVAIARFKRKSSKSSTGTELAKRTKDKQSN